MSYNAISFISLLHSQFYKSHYYLVNRHICSQKRVSHSFKIYFIRVAKYACLIYIKLICNAGKVTIKHSCEFVLTRAIKLIHVIPLRLHNLEILRKDLSSVLFLLKQLYYKETGAKGRLVKIGLPYHTLAVRPCSSLYVHCVTIGPYFRSQDCTSAPTSLRENLIFSPLSAYSPTSRANKGFLGPPNTYQNLHTK
jgi:hypothetical protein